MRTITIDGHELDYGVYSSMTVNGKSEIDYLATASKMRMKVKKNKKINNDSTWENDEYKPLTDMGQYSDEQAKQFFNDIVEEYIKMRG